MNAFKARNIDTLKTRSSSGHSAIRQHRQQPKQTVAHASPRQSHLRPAVSGKSAIIVRPDDNPLNASRAKLHLSPIESLLWSLHQSMHHDPLRRGI
ncbi:MAG: hypothetical protein H0T77_16385 [Pyrinomonadaceae bacterium]|nr:hypothetical protein [Pyrinomonadaceae bacterium]